MILEGIVTTRNEDGTVNVAPMGPVVGESFVESSDGAPVTFGLRPYRTSRTYSNLRARPQGVLHVTDDVVLLARAAINQLDELPETFPAERIEGDVLSATCRWYEFEIDALDESSDRIEAEARVVHVGRRRDFFGFNRAKHAVLEAAILATRLHLLPRAEILAEFDRLAVPVAKTAGTAEHLAFELLRRYVRSAAPD